MKLAIGALVGCGYSHHPVDSRDGGPPALDAGEDAEVCGEVDPCPPDDMDADEDGIPVPFDPDPDLPQETVGDEDFRSDPGWVAQGDGTWAWTPEGLAEQSGACDDRGSITTFESVNGPMIEHVYVEAKVRIPTCPGQSEGRGAGIFVRKADGQLLACLFAPTLPEEDDPQDVIGRAGIQVAVFEGADVSTAIAHELGNESNQVPMNEDDSGAVGPHWSEKWVTVRLLVDAFDVLCEARPGVRFDSWGLTWTDAAPNLPAGTAGLITWGAPAAFDDFRVVALDTD